MKSQLWSLTTPRRLRRNTAAVLAVWTALAFWHHSGGLDRAEHLWNDVSHSRYQLPVQVPSHAPQ